MRSASIFIFVPYTDFYSLIFSSHVDSAFRVRTNIPAESFEESGFYSLREHVRFAASLSRPAVLSSTSRVQESCRSNMVWKERWGTTEKENYRDKIDLITECI